MRACCGVHVADQRQRFGETPHADLLLHWRVLSIGDEREAAAR